MRLGGPRYEVESTGYQAFYVLFSSLFSVVVTCIHLFTWSPINKKAAMLE